MVKKMKFLENLFTSDQAGEFFFTNELISFLTNT